jgi:hypothetical protein
MAFREGILVINDSEEKKDEEFTPLFLGTTKLK